MIWGAPLPRPTALKVALILFAQGLRETAMIGPTTGVHDFFRSVQKKYILLAVLWQMITILLHLPVQTLWEKSCVRLRHHAPVVTKASFE